MIESHEVPTSYSLEFPFAHGEPAITANFRTEPEDFQVDEILGFQPSGEGEHVYLHIQKRGENTAWVAQQIAQLAGVQVMDVGYCGRKDRHAVTTQWFSVYLPHKDKEPDWINVQTPSIRLLHAARHTHKLRLGDHVSNQFVIRLRQPQPLDKAWLETRLQLLATQGVPNYYGEQRFGREGNNLQQAYKVLVERARIRDKQQRGLYLSAARSYLFNQVLARRVQEQNWNCLLDGESGEQPTAPLWGRGRPLVAGDLFTLESQVLAPWADWCNGLEHAGLSQERRLIQLLPQQLSWCWDQDDLVLQFGLGAGEFATTLLRELAILRTPDKTES